MLTQYKLTLVPDLPCRPEANWAYPLYAALLEKAPREFGDLLHQDGVSPISQHLTVTPEKIVWTVTLLGDVSRQMLEPVLYSQKQYYLKRSYVTLRVTDIRQTADFGDAQTFLNWADQGDRHKLTMETPAAFKSQGCYINLPSARLMMQSLVKKWNGCFPDCPIEDTDGKGVDALANGLRITSFHLSGESYCLKGSWVPGFVGEMQIENQMKGFHRQLANGLLCFADYAGIGIKTTLGMGGVRHNFL